MAGYGGGHLTAIKQVNDVEIVIQARSMARVVEAQLLAANALCYLVEKQLFGAYKSH
jgi:hypothetical protein